MDISVVIPIYGCRAALEELHRRLTDTLVAMDKEYEIILVNDYSPDHVWDKITELARADQHVKGLFLAKNFGQHSALMAGYRESDGDIVI